MVDNAKYKQFKVSLDPATVSTFKTACTNANVSMASVISRFMSDYSEIKQEATNKVNTYDYSTKRKRRAAIGKIIKQLEQIKDCEEAYIDRIPENLHSSSVYEKAEEFLSCLETAIDELKSIDSI